MIPVWYSFTILRFSLCGRYVISVNNKQNLFDKRGTNNLVVLPSNGTATEVAMASEIITCSMDGQKLG